MSKPSILYLFHKPFNCLSQFTKEHPDHVTLADYLKIPDDVYPIGRLDKDSEGLLLLSSNKAIVNQILNPKKEKEKIYWVQVEGNISDIAIQNLKKGVDIKHKNSKYHTLPAKLSTFENPPQVFDRVPPVRFRLNVPTSWIQLTIVEGKNRQVRKMLAQVGFPVLRLIRIQIDNYRLGQLKPGEYKKIEIE